VCVHVLGNVFLNGKAHYLHTCKYDVRVTSLCQNDASGSTEYLTLTSMECLVHFKHLMKIYRKKILTFLHAYALSVVHQTTNRRVICAVRVK